MSQILCDECFKINQILVTHMGGCFGPDFQRVRLEFFAGHIAASAKVVGAICDLPQQQVAHFSIRGCEDIQRYVKLRFTLLYRNAFILFCLEMAILTYFLTFKESTAKKSSPNWVLTDS